MAVIRTLSLEVRAVISALTILRVKNIIRVYLTYLFSLMLKRPVLTVSPFAISIEPTSICNLKCPECPTGAGVLKRARGSMDVDHFRKVIGELAPKLIYLNLYVQGEPFMHNRFNELIALATRHKLYSSTSTNGHFLNQKMAHKIVDAGLTRLIFSVDGVHQASYVRYRIGGNLEIVKQSIRNVVQAKLERKKKYPLIIIQFIVFKHNESEIPEMRKLAQELGVDKLEIKDAQLNNFGQGAVQSPVSQKYSRYQNNLIKGKIRNRCWRQWHSSVITWDGNMAPCCYDKEADFSFGNVYNNSVNELIRGTNSVDFKKIVFTDKQSIDICKNCPEGRSWFRK